MPFKSPQLLHLIEGLAVKVVGVAKSALCFEDGPKHHLSVREGGGPARFFVQADTLHMPLTRGSAPDRDNKFEGARIGRFSSTYKSFRPFPSPANRDIGT